MKRVFRILFCLGLIWPVGGCVSVGETAIRSNRTLYNEAIHDTSNQQLLLNMVRAQNFDAPTFLTAVEIDGTNTATASFGGGPSMLGALSGAVGTVTGTATLSDSPISKYQTLAGAELISQVSLPIPPQAISKLETSDWPVTPLISLTIQRFTPQFLDYYVASSLIDYLDRYGAVSFSSKGSADLRIVFHPNGNVRPDSIQTDDRGDVSTLCPSLRGVNDKELRGLWEAFLKIMGRTGTKLKEDSLLFGTVADEKGKKTDGLPIYTYSAYGSLRLAEHDVPIYIVHSEQTARNIRLFNTSPYIDADGRRIDFCSNGDFYYVDKHEEEPSNQSAFNIRKYWLDEAGLVRNLPKYKEDYSASLRDLGHHRVFVIIIKSKESIANSYVAVFNRGYWYSIDNDDTISKRNLSASKSNSDNTGGSIFLTANTNYYCQDFIAASLA